MDRFIWRNTWEDLDNSRVPQEILQHVAPLQKVFDEGKEQKEYQRPRFTKLFAAYLQHALETPGFELAKTYPIVTERIDLVKVFFDAMTALGFECEPRIETEDYGYFLRVRVHPADLVDRTDTCFMQNRAKYAVNVSSFLPYFEVLRELDPDEPTALDYWHREAIRPRSAMDKQVWNVAADILAPWGYLQLDHEIGRIELPLNGQNLGHRTQYGHDGGPFRVRNLVFSE